jgi:hypothetical protein
MSDLRWISSCILNVCRSLGYDPSSTWVTSDLQAVSGAIATARGVMGAYGTYQTRAICLLQPFKRRRGGPTFPPLTRQHGRAACRGDPLPASPLRGLMPRGASEGPLSQPVSALCLSQIELPTPAQLSGLRSRAAARYARPGRGMSLAEPIHSRECLGSYSRCALRGRTTSGRGPAASCSA